MMLATQDLFHYTVIGMCDVAQIYENPYEGAGHSCPMNGCLDDGMRDHNLRKRRAWICTDCLCCILDKKQPPFCHCDEVGSTDWLPEYCCGKVA